MLKVLEVKKVSLRDAIRNRCIPVVGNLHYYSMAAELSGAQAITGLHLPLATNATRLVDVNE